MRKTMASLLATVMLLTLGAGTVTATGNPSTSLNECTNEAEGYYGGVKVYAKDTVDSVTALMVPEGVDEPKLRKTIKASYGFHIAGGQGDLKGKIVRFSHMGYVDAFDTLGVISALELTLRQLGYKFEMGAGVAAAQKVFAESVK